MTAKEIEWTDPIYKKEQHILKVTYTPAPEFDHISYTVAGVHLTAKNTGASKGKLQRI